MDTADTQVRPGSATSTAGAKREAARRLVTRAAAAGHLQLDDDGRWWGVAAETGGGTMWMQWSDCPDLRYARAAEVATELLDAGKLTRAEGER